MDDAAGNIGSGPEYRHHGARLVELRQAEWRGVRAELITREADGPCDAAMCLRQHVVSLLCEGGRSGVVNRIANGPQRRVGQEPGWIRILPAGRPVRSHWERGRRTYLLAFIEPDYLSAMHSRWPPDGQFSLPEQLDLRSGRLRRVLNDMRQELCSPGPCTEEMGDALAAQLAVQLLRSTLPRAEEPARVRGGLSPRSLKAVLALMERRAGDKLHLRELAAEAGVSPHHFSHAFRQSTGTPPHRYLLERRLANARKLLEDPALSLMEVAIQAGFGGPSQFATAFRRATGTSPSSWRRAF